MQKVCTVLDIGSRKITALVGSSTASGSLVVYYKTDMEYSGFMNAQFFEEDLLESVIGRVLESAEINTHSAIKELTIGVPAEFCVSKLKKISATFNGRKRLTKVLLSQIYETAYTPTDNHTLTSVEPIYNILDDGQKIIYVQDMKTSKLTSLVNAMYINTNFIILMNKILQHLGIVKVNYVCSAFAEAQYLLNEGAVCNNAMVINIGFISSSVSVVRGGGLMDLFSFSMGGGHISADFMESLDLDFREAESLKTKIVLSLEASSSDMYDLLVDGKNRKIYTKTANNIVKSRLKLFAIYIKKCIEFCQDGAPDSFYLSGGGITFIKGAKNFLESEIGIPIIIAEGTLPEFNKPQNLSTIGLLVSSIKDESKKIKKIL